MENALAIRANLRQLRENIRGMSKKNVVKMVKASNRAALAPIRKEAARRVPKESGALRKSLGVQVNKRLSKGHVVAKVWPRPKFKAKGLNEDAPVDISERRSGHPRTYAYYIETGRTKARGRLRSAGPANYLAGAYNSQRIQSRSVFAKRMWQEIEKQAQKGKS